MSAKKIVVAMSGASGSAYALRLIEILLQLQHDVHLVASPTAKSIFAYEQNLLSKSMDFPALLRSALDRKSAVGKITYYLSDNFAAPIASGSFLTDGMVIVPCSTGSLAAIATGVNRHLIHRAAEVHLKERRKLLLVLRETPYSLTHIENMAAATRAGAVVLPASPPFYHRPETVDDLVDALVARILDQLGLEHPLDASRWPIL